MSDQTHSDKPNLFKALLVFDPDRWLACLYAPILPYLKKIKITRAGPRGHNPRDILLPEGYVAEVVATGFDAPVHCAFDDQGFCYVSKAGHKIDSSPRILKVNVQTGEKEVFFTLPQERWIKTGALTGACWCDGALYITNTDTLSRIGTDGVIDNIVTDLPGLGDHQTNYPVVGRDGKIHFGQGSATNAGVVGRITLPTSGFPTSPRHMMSRLRTARSWTGTTTSRTCWAM